jgi:hypothetical protein
LEKKKKDFWPISIKAAISNKGLKMIEKECTYSVILHLPIEGNLGGFKEMEEKGLNRRNDL